MRFDQKSGSVTGGNLKILFDNGITEISTLDIDNVNVGPYLRNTMVSDKILIAKWLLRTYTK